MQLVLKLRRIGSSQVTRYVLDPDMLAPDADPQAVWERALAEACRLLYQGQTQRTRIRLPVRLVNDQRRFVRFEPWQYRVTNVEWIM
jgi:hypothetical protein